MLFERILFSAVLTALFLISTSPVYGQQVIVDDAVVTTERSFQLEGWYGEFESELYLQFQLQAGWKQVWRFYLIHRTI